ncbi:MAG: ribonuclease HII [Armatimonadota bacterium]|jgi:ribonuclease HII
MTPAREARDEFGGPDRWALQRGHRLIAGVDEVGRGAMAGPLVAAAVILGPGTELSLVDDSKMLSPEQRDEAYEEIRERATAWAIGMVAPDMIDRLNVWGATCLAMRRALEGLSVQPDFALIDGLAPRGIEHPHQAFVGGDACSPRMGAASILAKVTRDRVMERLSLRYPGYAFADNKGYATPRHKEAVRRLGPSPIHRRRYWFVTDLRSDHLPFDPEDLARISHYGSGE